MSAISDINVYEQDTAAILKFAEQLIFQQTNIYCSELQQSLLLSVLDGERKNYEKIAEECGYSVTYIRQDVAPKLWQIFSHALDKRVNKANVRTILEKAIAQQNSDSSLEVVPSVTHSAELTSRTHPNGFSSPMPATWVHDGESTTASSAMGGDGADLALKGNILLVDDQPKNLRLLSDLLEEQGYEVQEAINGAVALHVVAVAAPDLVLLDIHMPEMDGYSVCQQLKADPKTKNIPVIFISAVDEAWDKVKAFSVGGVDYITKPFKVVEVLARVKNQLTLQALQQELRAQNAQLQQAIQELQRLAVIDQVTQVASRYRFDQYLQAEWQRAMQNQTPISLLLCDLDDFEAYLQTYGYQSGDRCLYQVGQAIKRVVQRPADLVCRYGGDIFAVVLPNIDAPQCEAIAHTILTQLESLRVSQSQDGQTTLHTVSLTASIGVVSLTPPLGGGLENLVERCDRALQEAKAAGRNTVIAFTDQING